MENLLGPSWSTKLMGILSILASIGGGAKLLMTTNFNFNDPLWLGVFAGVINGIGNLNARANKVSSEQVGAGPK